MASGFWEILSRPRQTHPDTHTHMRTHTYGHTGTHITPTHAHCAPDSLGNFIVGTSRRNLGEVRDFCLGWGSCDFGLFLGERWVKVGFSPGWGSNPSAHYEHEAVTSPSTHSQSQAHVRPYTHIFTAVHFSLHAESVLSLPEQTDLVLALVALHKTSRPQMETSHRKIL